MIFKEKKGFKIKTKKNKKYEDYFGIRFSKKA